MLDVVVKNNIKVKSKVFYGINEIPKVVDMLRKGQYQGKGVIIIDREAAEMVNGQEIESRM
jgi:propanol-preferring alcohol dehydrogenase